MKKDWLVYSVTYEAKETVWYVTLTYKDYQNRCRILNGHNSRTIIKKNLSYIEAENFRKILMKLRK